MGIPTKATVSFGIMAGLVVGLAISGSRFYRSRNISGRLTSILGSDTVQEEFEEYSKGLREHKKVWVN
jgi:hypothetical protein